MSQSTGGARGWLALPRISKRRRRWLGSIASPSLVRAIEAIDPFYLAPTQADVLERSLTLIAESKDIVAASDILFVDLGFNNRIVFDAFYNRFGARFRWCGLELQEALCRSAVNDAHRYAANPVEFVHAAAALDDGTIEIALDGDADGYHPNDGSTTVLSITRDKSGRRAMAPCLDIARFLLERSKPETRIILKMDVEGAEYHLLPHLLRSPVADRLSFVLCEFHWRRFPFPGSIGKAFQTQSLIRAFRAKGCEFYSWR